MIINGSSFSLDGRDYLTISCPRRGDYKPMFTMSRRRIKKKQKAIVTDQ